MKIVNDTTVIENTGTQIKIIVGGVDIAIWDIATTGYILKMRDGKGVGTATLDGTGEAVVGSVTAPIGSAVIVTPQASLPSGKAPYGYVSNTNEITVGTGDAGDTGIDVWYCIVAVVS
jgi:hypothetical protein